jgi:CRISPR-associated protein Csx17
LHRRNGLAFAAVPVDRVSVQANSDVRLLASVEDWPARIPSDAPGAIRTALRGFEAAQLQYARTGRALELGRMLAALTTLEQAVSRSGRAKESVRVRRPASARPFLDVLIKEPSIKDFPELRIAAGIASCAVLPGFNKEPDRTMRQILLPIDPPGAGEQSRIAGRWRDAPVVAGLGARPLHEVLAGVLVWRCRSAVDEPDKEKFRGVVTFRSGIRVPAGDLHAMALGQLDDAALAFWLRACLALDWRGLLGYRWTPGQPPGMLAPTLALLHPFAAGLESEDAEAGTLGLRPDWANRLSAGQIQAVHNEAATRLLQTGWRAVPYPVRADGTRVGPGGVNASRLVAALVPRSSGHMKVLSMVASRRRPDDPGRQEPGVKGAAVTGLPAPAA